MSSHNLMAAMKARTKIFFQGTKKDSVTTIGIKSSQVTILGRGTVEPVEYANTFVIKPALKYVRKNANHATTATDHSAAKENFAKKVQWPDETADSTSSTGNNENCLTTTFEVARIKEQHHTEKYRNKVHSEGLEDLSYTMPCEHHLKCQKLKKKASMRGLPTSSFKGDIVVNETGKKGGSVLSFGFTIGLKSVCGLGKKNEMGGFQLKGVKKVSKNEGNGAIFNGGDFRDEAPH